MFNFKHMSVNQRYKYIAIYKGKLELQIKNVKTHSGAF